MYVEVAKLTAADAAAYDYFGYSVAIDGGTIVVGACGDDSLRGAAYVFRTTDGGATYARWPSWTAADGARRLLRLLCGGWSVGGRRRGRLQLDRPTASDDRAP